MRVAVIGAGVTGLVAALRLAQRGHEPVVFERWPGLGGQAATLDVGGGVRLERYYHHLFTSDTHMAGLYEELGISDQLVRRPSDVAFFAGGELYPFNGPADLLRFRPLRPADRLRMGTAVLRLQHSRAGLKRYESSTAREWIRRHMGERCWEALWGPLLRGKFGSRAEDISMAWIWSKLSVRRGKGTGKEMLVYPVESFEPLYERLQAEIERRGGRVLIDRPAVRIERLPGGGLGVTAGAPDSFRRGHDPRQFEPAGHAEGFDSVLATVPTDIFERLLSDELRGEVGEGYLSRARSIEYHTAFCLLLELDRPVSSHYWMNVSDRDLPFLGLIEHTNLIDPSHYGGRRFLYVANYLEPGDPVLSLGPDELIERYEPGLRRVNPDFSRNWIRERWLHTEPAAQPIVDVGYRDRMPALRTKARGLVLANTTQIYPEDRGTNYSVRLAEEAVDAVEDA